MDRLPRSRDLSRVFGDPKSKMGVARPPPGRSVSRTRISTRARENHGELHGPAADRARTWARRAPAHGAGAGGSRRRGGERRPRVLRGLVVAVARVGFAAGLPRASARPALDGSYVRPHASG